MEADFGRVGQYLRQLIDVYRLSQQWCEAIGCPWTEMLLGALSSRRSDVRAWAAHTLGERGDPKAIPALAALARSADDVDVRRRALTALSRIAGDDGPGSWNPGDHARPEAAAVLVEATAWTDVIEKEHEWWLARVVGRVCAVKGVRPMIAVLRGEAAGSQRIAVLALGYLRDPRGVPAVVAVLEDVSSPYRCDAAWAAGEICDPRAIPALQRASEAVDPELRLAATEALARQADEYGERACVKALVARLTDTPAIRKAAAKGLAAVPEPESLEALRAALFLEDAGWDDADPNTGQAYVLTALAALRDPSTGDDFVRVLDDANSGGWPAALLGLAAVGDARLLSRWNRYFESVGGECGYAASQDWFRVLRQKVSAALERIAKGRELGPPSVDAGCDNPSDN